MENIWIRTWNKARTSLHSHRGFKAQCLLQDYLKRIVSTAQCQQSQSYK